MHQQKGNAEGLCVNCIAVIAYLASFKSADSIWVNMWCTKTEGAGREEQRQRVNFTLSEWQTATGIKSQFCAIASGVPLVEC